MDMRTEALIRVYSHPRSGTGLLMEYVARCFYAGVPLEISGGQAGHWADRRPAQMQHIARLFGSHLFPGKQTPVGPAVYIARDGRDVMASLWNAKMMLSPADRGLPFSDWLARPLDWIGSPGHRAGLVKLSPAEHWAQHVDAWIKVPGVHVVRYEDLVQRPGGVMLGIAARFGITSWEFERIGQLVGTAPNRGIIGGWRSVFSSKDELLFHRYVDRDHWALYE